MIDLQISEELAGEIQGEALTRGLAIEEFLHFLKNNAKWQA